MKNSYSLICVIAEYWNKSISGYSDIDMIMLFNHLAK